jgi:maleylacetoacetate isomerase
MSEKNFRPRLYGYWRSSASWRLRWAFALKKFDFEYVPVNILKGEPKEPAHLARNVLGLLPIFEPTEGVYLAESLAVMEWLEETHSPHATLPTLYPGSAIDRARIRGLCELINADTAPLQTPRAQKRHSDDPAERSAWAAHFIREGLKGFEGMSKAFRKEFSYGSQVTAADLCLVPQIYNALRFGLDVANEFPALWEIYSRCRQTEECAVASPERQVDAELKS